MALGWAAALAATLLLAAWSWLWASRLRCSAPGPRPLPLIGNALQVALRPFRLSHIRDMHRRYGDVFRLYVGTKLFMLVTQPEDAYKVLVAMKHRQREPFFMNPLRILMGDGLVTCDWNTWKAHRRLAEPIFRTEALERFAGALHAAGGLLCDRLEALGGAEADMYQLLFEATLRGLLDTVFGVQLDGLEPHPARQNELLAELIALLKNIEKRILNVWIRNKWSGSRMFAGSKLRSQLLVLDRLVSYIVSAAGSSSGNTSLVSLMSQPQPRGRRPATPRQVRDEICTFIAAGTETSTSTLGFVLVLLSQHPEWQDAAFKELDAVFGAEAEFARPSTYEDLSQLPVLDSIIKETLRLFPVVPSVGVRASEDVALAGAGAGVVAPRGCCVSVSLSLLHRQARCFPAPDRFDPSRFLPGGSAGAAPPYSFLPFGAGPRQCVGSRFAMLQMRATLAAVLRRYRVLPPAQHAPFEDFPIYVTIFPHNGFRVRCVPRDHAPLELGP